MYDAGISTDKDPPKVQPPDGAPSADPATGAADDWSNRTVKGIRKEVDDHATNLHNERVKKAEHRAAGNVAQGLQKPTAPNSRFGFSTGGGSGFGSVVSKFLQDQASPFGYDFRTGSESKLGKLVRESADLLTETEATIATQRQSSKSGEILYQLDLLKLSIAHADTLALGDSAMANTAIHLLQRVNSALSVLGGVKSAAEAVAGGVLKSLVDYATILRTGMDPDTGEKVTYSKFMWTSLEWFGPNIKALGLSKAGAAQLYVALGTVLSKGGKAAKLAGPVREAIARASKSMSEMMAVREDPVGKVFDLARERGVQLVAQFKSGYIGVGKGPKNPNHYRDLFFTHYPEAEGKVVVHHAVEQGFIDKRYPGLFLTEELQSIENLRGIPKQLNSKVHLSELRISWNGFYAANKNPTREKILEHAKRIDDRYGHLFIPPIR